MIGGVILTLIVSVLFQCYFLPSVGALHAAVLGLSLAVLSVVGDLVESMFKRATGIKDSGNIMPGHGGIIDRLDSLLFTIPAGYIYYTFLIA